MVREFTELQGTMGGVYARAEGHAGGGVEGDLLPLPADRRRGRRAAVAARSSARPRVTWAAVSLADKLDTIVGLFAAGEKPTGSRDPYGLRRAAQGVFKILVDLPELTGRRMADAVWSLVEGAGDQLRRPVKDWRSPQDEGLHRVPDANVLLSFWRAGATMFGLYEQSRAAAICARFDHLTSFRN